MCNIKKGIKIKLKFFFRSIHQTCVIWQRKCKNRYRRLWNPLSPRSRYTSKINPHSNIRSWSCFSFQQSHTFYTIWLPTNYWRHHSQEPITQHNRFLAQTGMVPILNVAPETINAGLKDRVLAITSVKGLEPTYLTTKSGKWLVILKKNMKRPNKTGDRHSN